MDNTIITQLQSNFENASKTQDGVTYWFARDIQVLLEYEQWRNFELVVDKSKLACANSGQSVDDHFADVSKMVEIGSGSSRKIKDIMLTRYACYLIAQNGDPRKDAIAFAQSYFAIQTRKQEILEEHLQAAERIRAREKLTDTEKHLSSTLYRHGVDSKGFGEIRSKGDTALFGGNNTYAMKKRLGVKDSRALADFLPTVTLKAKEFAAAITDFNVKKKNLFGVDPITGEHVQNNKDVREVLLKSDIKPEELPAEEDIKKLQRRVDSSDKKLLKAEASLKILNEEIVDS